MLSNISETLGIIVDFFKSIVDFVVGFVEDTITMVKTLTETVTAIPDLISTFLPPYAIAGILGLFAILVIYIVIGRSK